MAKREHKKESDAAPEAPQQLERLKAEKQELLDHLQRLQAEFDNFRKRIEREQQEHKAAAADTLLRDLLPVMDNFHLALGHAKDGEGKIRGDELLAGIILVKDQLQHLLADHGVEELLTTGTFDPAKHEALMTVQQDGVKTGTIIQTFQRGYMRSGKIMRPAKVSVAR